MIMAYKGFDKNLSCTSSGHKFQYKLGIWNEEPKANCAKNGFHCAEDPIDCLSYYSNWEGSVYYLVLADGDIHEDGYDSKIACTRMKLIKKLSLEDFVAEALLYISNHPLRNWNSRVQKEEGTATSNFTIVRGKEPIAKGKKGSILGFVKEYINNTEIEEIGILIVDGKEIMEDTWYSIEGKQV